MAVPGWAEIGFLFRDDREVSARCCGHHGSAIQNSVDVVGGCMNILRDGLNAGLWLTSSNSWSDGGREVGWGGEVV